MMEIPMEKLLEKVDNPYELVMLAAKRTRQLTQGSPKLVEGDDLKLSTIALREIAEGKIKCKK